jgi:pyruvate dehydrogenase E1 component beta subunit
MKPVVVHPRMDFMLYGMDAVVNQAAKWSHMVGGQAGPGLTIRTIINRGGEQGAQHSQALHAWFAHVPGLRVVMPATVADSRDLLISSVLCPDPVIFIDDRWLYDLEDDLPPVIERSLASERPQCLRSGEDLTIVASGYSTRLALEAAALLQQQGVATEVIDLRVLNPFYPDSIVASVSKTSRLLVLDGGWSPCGMAGEVIASVVERIVPGALKKSPVRVSLPFSPAPTSRVLEKEYYPTAAMVVSQALKLMDKVC